VRYAKERVGVSVGDIPDCFIRAWWLNVTTCYS
jgi:hypothetical protein